MNDKRQSNPRPPTRFLRSVSIDRAYVRAKVGFPFNIPAVRNLSVLTFDPYVTFLVGENGTGKSTLVEAIAAASRFGFQGGPKGPAGASTELSIAMSIERTGLLESDGYFLRAESFYNIASSIHDTEGYRAYGGKDLHHQSHGESFMALVGNRFYGNGLYILDEPEAALSPSRQLVLLGLIDRLARNNGSQFIIATHSPILLAYPYSTIYSLDADGIAPIAYEDTEHYKVTLDFLTNREKYLRHLTEEST